MEVIESTELSEISELSEVNDKNTIRLSHNIDYFNNMYMLLKKIHLKQIMGYRKIVKKIVQTIDLPEKMIERLIIDYVGVRQFIMF